MSLRPPRCILTAKRLANTELIDQLNVRFPTPS